MKDVLVKAGKMALQNKGAIVNMAKDEAADVITSTAKGFVWRYIILGNIIVGTLSFLAGAGITYLIM